MDDSASKSFKLKDVNSISKAIGDVWDLESEIPNKFLLNAVCKAYLYYQLSKSNYVKVVIHNGELLSFLAGRIERKSNYTRFPYLLLCFFYVFIMIFFKYGRSVLKYQLQFNSINDKIFECSNKSYDAELVLFLTTSKARGRGLGKSMLLSFNNHVKSLGLSNVYLFTDSYCNYQFYDKLGYHRVITESRNFIFTEFAFQQDLYLYEYSI